MAFPSTRAEMIEQGYKPGNLATCGACKSRMQYWQTPKGKAIPMNPMPAEASQAISHFATCSEAASFRKPRKG